MRRVLHSILQPWRILGLIFLILGAYTAVIRFTRGLGASTNLTDQFPWGLWVGFDILCGVGLAAGGFTISAMVYILRLDKYRPLARPAVLTAFIGYVLVIGGLMFDLGRPWNIWHPLVMWNHHSVMFEISWCVTLYTLVLAAEVSAMVFERLQWTKTTHMLHVLTLPLTLAAVLLSMLHQSSLGSLFLLVPGRLDPLWYSPLLPVLFFISAIGVGLVMTIVESNLSARAFGREIEQNLLKGVARVAAVVMGIYLIIRLTDMVRRGALTTLWPLDRASIFFLAEILIGFALPMVLFAQARVRRNRRWLYHAAQLGVLGFIINRLDVAVTGFEVVTGYVYIPAWTEVAVTLSLVTVGVVLFNLAGRYLPVFETESADLESEQWWQREAERQAAYGIPLAANLDRRRCEGA
jgi:Ni/Fe-hydrogenase subunit HybB-like protein